ncbi:hypothetical protein NL676_004715 [Syzygium grande]|nr:hypothetical protein NL676_004715 [Syzygium grande]
MRKQKANQHKLQESEQLPKKPKAENNNGHLDCKPSDKVNAEFEELCRATEEHLFVDQMHEIPEANGQDSSGTPGAVTSKWYSAFYITYFKIKLPVLNV